MLHHLDARGEGLARGRHVGVVHAGCARTLPVAARPPVAELGARLLPAPVDQRLLGGRLPLGAARRPRRRLLRLGLCRRLGFGLGSLALLLGALILRTAARRLLLVRLLLRARQPAPQAEVLEPLLGAAPLGGALDGEELAAVLEQLAARLRNGGGRGSASGRPTGPGVGCVGCVGCVGGGRLGFCVGRVGEGGVEGGGGGGGGEGGGGGGRVSALTLYSSRSASGSSSRTMPRSRSSSTCAQSRRLSAIAHTPGDRRGLSACLAEVWRLVVQAAL